MKKIDLENLTPEEIKAIREILKEPPLPRKGVPASVFTDDQMADYVGQRICESGSAAKLARELNIDRRYISKALNGVIQPQLASALGYGSQLLRIWVKTKKK